MMLTKYHFCWFYCCEVQQADVACHSVGHAPRYRCKPCGPSVFQRGRKSHGSACWLYAVCFRSAVGQLCVRCPDCPHSLVLSMLQSPMSRSLQEFSKFAVLFALMWPAASLAIEQVKCSIAAIHLPVLNKSLPLDEPGYVGGHVDVLCTSTLGEPLPVEFALLEVEEKAPKNGGRESSRIRVDLFSDRGMHKALPKEASQVTDFPTRSVVSGAGESRVSVPFHAKVSLEALIAAGSYSIGRDIGLVYRASVARD